MHCNVIIRDFYFFFFFLKYFFLLYLSLCLSFNVSIFKKVSIISKWTYNSSFDNSLNKYEIAIAAAAAGILFFASCSMWINVSLTKFHNKRNNSFNPFVFPKWLNLVGQIEIKNCYVSIHPDLVQWQFQLNIFFFFVFDNIKYKPKTHFEWDCALCVSVWKASWFRLN